MRMHHHCGRGSDPRFAGRGRGRGFGATFGPGGFRVDFGEGFGGPQGFGRGRRGRRRMFESGELRLVLLKLIADQPRHGYELIKAIEETTGGEYAPSPGIVYPTLTMLEDMGLVEERPGEGSRKAYAVTEQGLKQLEEKADDVGELFGRLEEMAPHSQPGPAIGRAVGNLMNALSHRIGREGISEELMHDIAAILDEAAQRIERAK